MVSEEPLEIRLETPAEPPRRVTVTMRTPGHDFDLALGWVLHEGLTIHDEISRIAYCTDADLSPEQEFNVVTVSLRAPLRHTPGERYGGPTAGSSACGVCGSESVEDVLRVRPPAPATTEVSAAILTSLPDLMRPEQRLFDLTGGLHAAAAFSLNGDPVLTREDVGRHNALDKLTGAETAAGGTPAPLVAVSGRLGFEVVQKAAASGRQALIGVGAPTGLAVRLAREAGLVLAGFSRADRMVVYAGASRLVD